MKDGKHADTSDIMKSRMDRRRREEAQNRAFALTVIVIGLAVLSLVGSLFLI